MVTWIGAGVFASAASLIQDKMKEDKIARSKSDGSTNAETEKRKDIGGVGASGSIIGVFALLTCMLPHMPVQIFMLPFAISSRRMLAATAVYSIAALQFGWLPNLGHAAHLGGMAFGVLFSVILKTRGKGGFKSWIALNLFR